MFNKFKLYKSFILITVVIIYFFVFIGFVYAIEIEDKNPLGNLQIKIPGIEELMQNNKAECIKNADGKTVCLIPWIGIYISAVYKYAVGIVGILATVVMMFGGVLWITAGGNQERIGNAKSWITASLTGLVLVLCSYMILYVVNPDLTRFKPIEIGVAEKPPDISSCCMYDHCNNTACTITTKMCTDTAKSRKDCEDGYYKNGKYTPNAKCKSIVSETTTFWSCSPLAKITGTKNGCCVYWHGNEDTGYIVCKNKTNIGEKDIEVCEEYKDGAFYEDELCTNITECPD